MNYIHKFTLEFFFLQNEKKLLLGEDGSVSEMINQHSGTEGRHFLPERFYLWLVKVDSELLL